MKVLVQSHRDPRDSVQGAERALIDFIDLWQEQQTDLEVVLVSPDQPGLMTEWARSRGWRAYQVGLPWWIVPVGAVPVDANLSHLVSHISSASIIRDIIRREKPDIAVTNTIVAPATALAASAEKIPHVWLAHEFGKLGVNIDYTLGEAETLRMMSELSSFIVCNSHATHDHFTQFISPEKLRIVHPCLSAGRLLTGTTEHENSADEFRIVSVGRITPNKNQLALVEAVSKLTNSARHVQLDLIGPSDVEYLNQIQRKIRELNLGSHIRLIGEVTDPTTYVREADLFVNCSHNESFGLSTFEAQYVGVPALVASTSGTSEIVVDGETGMVITDNTSDSLAQALANIMTHPETLAPWKHNSAARAKRLLEQARKDASAVTGEVTTLSQSAKVTSMRLLNSVIMADLGQADVPLLHQFAAGNVHLDIPPAAPQWWLRAKRIIRKLNPVRSNK